MPVSFFIFARRFRMAAWRAGGTRANTTVMAVFTKKNVAHVFEVDKRNDDLYSPFP